MKNHKKFFKETKSLPVDKFFQKVLYEKKIGYYNTIQPFGEDGDFITAPKISNLFSEMIAIWIISTWENFNKPKVFNIVELGPGDGSLMKVLIDVFKKFPNFNNAKKIYFYEKSELLTSNQKKYFNKNQVSWIDNFDKVRKGPVIFFGNEFLDAIPIKQFVKKKNIFLEKYFQVNQVNNIEEIFKKASKKDVQIIKSFKTLKELKFIEFPKLGFKILDKIIKKIQKFDGCLLLIDYGYIKQANKNTLQSVKRHKKNDILKNLGEADVTSHVNFSLLDEYFLKNKMKVKKTITQNEFLRKLGIIERADILGKKMKFSDQTNLYLRLKRLLSPKSMGNLFKVILAYKFKKNNYLGFE